ncbi:MAG TPA: NYN domain-containing protein [Solirubrobacterales bacterium]|nr:NYN domain-containing protein [Solirubrobacterales bacterium]
MAANRVRVAVFIDWQNVYKTAREAFGMGKMPSEYGNFSPFKLSRLLALGNGRAKTGELVCVEVHRGLPSQRHDPKGYAANRRQAAAWKKESPLVVPKMRSLRYPRNFPAEQPVEKGVDVALAVGAIEATLRKRCDVAIIFSHDTDLLPVPEAIARLAGADCVETASWASQRFQGRLRPKSASPIVHHPISERVFKAVEDPTNYARK